MAIYNPGEPVWDPVTGDIVDDPDTGDALLVVGTDNGESAAYWPDPVTGVVYQRDDVTNAVWYRVNTRVGEVLRDRTIGINYNAFVFGEAVSRDLLNAEVSAAVRTVPGVAALINGRFVSFDAAARSAVFLFSVRKKSGSVAQGVVAVG